MKCVFSQPLLKTAALYSSLTIISLASVKAADTLYDPPKEEVSKTEQAEPIKAAQPLAKPSSTTGTITVTGGSQPIRSIILSQISSIEDSLSKLCNDSYEGPLLPITIQLHGKTGDPSPQRSIRTSIEEVEGSYQLKLDIHIGKKPDTKLLDYHAMETLLYERGLSSGQTIPANDTALVKPWLITGLLEAIRIKAGKEDKKIYQAEVDHFKILSLDTVFETSEKNLNQLIGAETSVYRAIAGAIVNSILRQPKGRVNMEAYIADVATFKGEPENLMRKHFPGMNNSASSLSKWVKLEILELGTAATTQAHSIQETDKLLTEALSFQYGIKTPPADTETNEVAANDITTTPPKIIKTDISSYRDLLALPPKQRRLILSSPLAQLQRLSYRAFPTYKPLIYEYTAIISEVLDGKDKNTLTRLRNLQSTRQSMLTAGSHATDYLNWYYITQSNDLSDNFAKFRKLSEKIEHESSSPATSDHLGRYLDNTQNLYRSR